MQQLFLFFFYKVAGFRKRESQVIIAVKEADDNESEEIAKVKKVWILIMK